MDLNALLQTLQQQADSQKAASYRRFFKNSQQDIFLGVGAKLMHEMAKVYWQLSFSDVLSLLKSNVHEEAAVGRLILRLKYKKSADLGKDEIFDFYLKHRGFIHDWNGVDDSAPYIIGPHLLNNEKTLLYKLAKSTNIWDRRIAIVSTWWFIRNGQVNDTFQLAELLLNDHEDLIHKAVGWMLREAGKRDLDALKAFLAVHHHHMPRTMLRYAVEKFPADERQVYVPLRSVRTKSVAKG